jgi:hypothetical protein
MKKLIAIVLILLALGSYVFADDAKVMPKMVGRFYLAPSYSFASKTFDDDGKSKSLEDMEVKAFNLGLALEFGVTDWITAAIQWVPGLTPWSEAGKMGGSQLNTNGVADLFVGAKLQIIGEKAPVENDMFRVAVAPGFIIPLPGPNFKDEGGKLGSGDTITAASMDKHVFGAGARFYFDYIINDMFFVNLFNETIIYLAKQDIEKSSLSGAMMAAYYDKIDYGYKLTFELEPVFSMPIADGMNFYAGLPFRYKTSPAPKYGDITDPAGSSYALHIGPNVGLFLTNTPLPLEFKLQYLFPVMGKNDPAMHTIMLQIRAYFALPGADR